MILQIKDAAYAEMRAKDLIFSEFEAQYETELNQICKDGGFDAAAMDSFARVKIGQVPPILIGDAPVTFDSYAAQSRSVFPKTDVDTTCYDWG